MSRLLYIQASPRKQRSRSRKVADAFVEGYRQAHPDDEIVTLDLFEADLPAFDGLTVQAKYTILHGLDHSEDEAVAWRDVEDVIAQFTSADKYVLATPMWNFGVPYRLKHYIDVLVQPSYTFSFSPEEGYAGLITGKPILLVQASGGDYSAPEAAALDHQRSYLAQVLGFIGFEDIHSIVIEPTLHGGPEVAEQKTADALARARALAETF